MKRSLPPLIGVFITVFLDLLAFGMFIPDMQIRGTQLGAKGFTLGMMLACFSLAQLLFAPLLGRLSDNYGRRPILIVSTIGAAISFALYANAHSLVLMYLARSFAGIASANLGVAYAYVADVTEEKERAKGLALVGAAFALGFILGAPFGALLVKLGSGEPALLGYTAFAMAFVNMLYIYFWLPESLKNRSSKPRRYTDQFRDFIYCLKDPKMGHLLLLYFVANFAFANLESTYMMLNVYCFKLTVTQSAMIFMYIGLVMAIFQGGIIRVLIPKFGELKLLRFGYFLQAPAIALLPFSPPWLMLLVVMFFVSIGKGMSDPNLNSLISRSAPTGIQGGIFGVTQSMGALARMTSPIIANILFVKAMWLPYVFAGVLMILPIFGTFRVCFKKSLKASAS